ncbi:hypothetical protein EMIT0P253_320007 [Pseudomonas sp. IT-P253]|jgi:dienelactone hydrolase
MSQLTVRSVAYQLDGQTFESGLVFEADHKGPRPGLLMAPNWMGISAGAEEIAKSVASKGYVVLIADVYGASEGSSVVPREPGFTASGRCQQHQGLGVGVARSL